MKITLLRGLAAAFLFVSIPQLHTVCAAPAAAAAQPVEAEVSSIKFSAARFGSDAWFEADVEVDAKPGGKLVSGQFLDRVRVTLSVGMESTDEKGAKIIKFYRSSAEALTIEAGKANFRFYFPPEIVKRDKIRTPVTFYAAEVEVGGKVQDPVKTSFSSSITSSASLQNFISKAASESVSNEGFLIPQFLTPFSADPQKRSPTFSRKEAQR